MLAAVLDPNALGVAAITALLGGGAGLALKTWFTARPEAAAIGARALIEVNSELRTEVKRLGTVVDEQRVQIDRQDARIREQDALLSRQEDRIRALTLELDDLETRRDELGQ